MKEIVIWGSIGVMVLFLLVVSVVTIRYHITRRCLKITWMGIPVRWVRLKNIKQISMQRMWIAERWKNTLQPSNRYLMIHKHHGILKHLIITPKNHMVFKAELEQARNRVLGVESQRASFTATPEKAAS